MIYYLIIKIKIVSIGHVLDDPNELRTVIDLWKDTKISKKITSSDSLLYARWTKLCWNIPYNGLAVSMGGLSTDVICNDPDLRVIADNIMTDVINLANSHITAVFNCNKSNSSSIFYGEFHMIRNEVKLLDMTEIKESFWKITDSIGPYKTSTVLDLICGNEMELEYLFIKPLEVAKQLTNDYNGQTSWPHLETVIRKVLAIDRIAKLKRSKGISWQANLIN